MRVFGNVVSLVDFDGGPRRARPNDPDPRAQAEMKVFDELEPETRRAIANSPFGAAVSVMHGAVMRRGASRRVQERLRARGKLPCDVGTEGVMLEEIAIVDDLERQRIAALLVR